MHIGTRAVTWSLAAERKQRRDHPAHVDRYINTSRRDGRLICTRVCENCERTYTYITDMERGGPADDGLMYGLCHACDRA